MTFAGKNKKAISPLIATVLLIAFTMTIAVLIQNFFTGFFSAQQSSTTDKSTATLNCAYARLKINSISYNGTSTTLKTRITNENQNSKDGALANITFSVIMRDGSSNAYGASCNCADESLYPGDTKIYSNVSVAGGCNITSVYVSSNCPNARDTAAASDIGFSGC